MGELAGHWGSTRASGARAALAPASAPVDGRTLPQLMCLVGEFAQLFNFTAPDGSPDGDWSAFFAHDVSFVLAQILCHDLQGERDRIAAIVHGECDPEQRDLHLLDRLWMLLELVSKWAVALRRIDATQAPAHGSTAGLTLEALIATVLRPLFASLPFDQPWSAALAERSVQFFTDQTDELRWLGNLWVSETAAPVPAAPPDVLHQVFLAALDAIGHARPPLQVCFDASLAQTFGHQPHTALMAAFLQLLRHAQDDANAITGRHLDYYFKDLLDLPERGAGAGVALLSFRAPPHGAPATLPAGTRLKGGKALQYAVDVGLTVHQDAIVALHALHAKQGAPLWRQGPRAVLRIDVDAPAPVASRTAGPAWAPFGSGDRASAAGATDATDATIGILLTTPMVLLRGGHRSVHIRFQYAALPQPPFASFITVARAWQQAVATALGSGAHAALARSFMQDACEVWLTTAAGWQRATRVTVRADAGTAAIELGIVLAPAFAPVVAGPVIKGEAGAGSPWPRLKIVLRPDARVFPYTYLQQLQLLGITVRTRVRGLVPAQVTVNGLVQPAGQPFHPFGSASVAAPGMDISDPELRGKPIVRGAIRLHWRNLPANEGGLALRYAGYAATAWTNNVFQARVDIVGPDGVLLAGAARPLFTAEDNPDALLQPCFRLVLEPAAAPARPWDLLCMRLCAPAGGFGQDRYPQLLAAATYAAARTLSGEAGSAAPGKTTVPPAFPWMPQPPLIPAAGNLLIDYLASAPLARQAPGVAPGSMQPCYYQLGPFGYRAASVQGTTLLDDCGHPGQLLIGLRDVTPGQVLALLFGMCANARQQRALRCDVRDGDSAAPLAALDWYHLQDNAWQRFAPAALLADGTDGLMRSGVLRLQTPPQGLDCANTLLPPGVCWIAARAATPDAHSDLTLVDTQGASATQVIAMPGTPAAPVLAPATITGFVGRPAGIDTVLQVLPTLAGRPAETTAAYRQRVSQRLRHKQRPVSGRDFEQLVLDDCLDVFQARCLHAAARPLLPLRPGVVAMVLVPQPDASEGAAGAPVLAAGRLLDIAQWLRGHASAALRSLRVFSPQYEELKVCVQLDSQAGAPASVHRLDAAISAWLAPWRGSGGALPIGGDGRGVDDLAAWLGADADVLRVRSLQVLHTFEVGAEQHARWLVRGQPFTPRFPWSVMLPAAHHAIALNGEAAYGIGQLAVGQDVMVVGAVPAGLVLAPGAAPGVLRPVRLALSALPRVGGDGAP